MTNDIDIKEQESFNEVFSVLEEYSHAVIEINDKLEVSFYISKNDLDHNLMIRKVFDSFVSYMKLHLRQGKRIYHVKATDTDDYKHTFEIPKDSKLYKLIINYIYNPPSKKSIYSTFAQGGILDLDKDRIKSIVDRSCDLPEQIISNSQFKKKLDELQVKLFTLKPQRLNHKTRFKTGDKVKIIKDFLYFICGENVNLKGFEGVVFSSLNVVSGMYNQNVLNVSYDVDVNGFIIGGLQESYLELIEQSQKLKYRADLYDLADDIDGVLLPDSKPSIDFIQKVDK